MSQRSIRVNELVKREVSDLLHTYYKDDGVYITIIDVNVSPDLRQARIYYSVFGDETRVEAAKRFFAKRGTALRKQVGQRIVLKYLPHFKFFYDQSIERGNSLIELLDEVDREQGRPEENQD